MEGLVPENLIKFFNEGTKFLIAGHKEPDGDCVGSQLALSLFLKRMGKEAIPCSAGPFKRSEIRAYEELFTPNPDTKNARAVILDCSTPDRTGDLEPLLDSLPLAVIDHHRWIAGKKTDKEAVVKFIDITAPATTVLVMRLIKAMGMEMSKEEAEYLFFGLCTDTGFFRHVDVGGVDTFESAIAMINAGASPKTAYHSIYGGKSLNSRKLLGLVLNRVESYYDGKLLLSSEEYEETCLYGLEGRDTDSFYQLLQSVNGVEVIVIIRQETPEKTTIGLRSRSYVDVGRIAENLGGGGHKHAAGGSLPGTIPEVKSLIIDAFKKVF
ncbi:MAG: bifunctional oligoribonuclease/PAP phosphatase NrnA [Treponema sp.]|nr:bifunctional oligoribonuclease/PAP phosphatase NrnA [Treponema sp.]